MKIRTRKPKMTKAEEIKLKTEIFKGAAEENKKQEAEFISKEKETHIEKLSREQISNIRFFFAMHHTIPHISGMVGASEEIVEQVIDSLSETVNPKSQMFAQLDAYDVMTLSLMESIGRIKDKIDELDKPKDPKEEISPFAHANLSIELQQLYKLRIDVLKAKSALLKSINQMGYKNTNNQKLTQSEILVLGIINDNPPKISSEEIAEKSGLSISRIRQILNGENGNIGLIKKGYVQGIPENLEKGGAKIYYSANMS